MLGAITAPPAAASELPRKVRRSILSPASENFRSAQSTPEGLRRTRLIAKIKRRQQAGRLVAAVAICMKQVAR